MTAQRTFPSGVIALLTDFGLADPYVGQMKGALLRCAPSVRILDISHDVPAFGILQAAFFLEASRPFLPDGAVVLVVVDPGVGGPRRMVGIQAFGNIFLGPDNGVFSLLLDATNAGGVAARAFDFTLAERSSFSATFYGRDIFAPLAARLAMGVACEELGRPAPLDSLVRLDTRPPVMDGERLRVRVVHVDRFGNCALQAAACVWEERLAGWPAVWMQAPLVCELDRVRAYYQLGPQRVGILAGSQGFLELALNQGSAAAHIGLGAGDALVLAPRRGAA